MKTAIKSIEYNLPAHGDDTASTVVGNKIVFVTIRYDSDCNSPTEDCDGMGVMYSGSNRHNNFKPLDELQEMAKADPDAVKLSYYEHGQSLWYVASEYAGFLPDKQWDGVSFAGLWVPDECVRESYQGQDGLTRRAWMLKQAQSCCAEYTRWCNGECYGYEIKVYKLERDEDGEPLTDQDYYPVARPIWEDSCWGYIGWDYAVESTKEALPDLKQLESIGKPKPVA